MAGSLPKSTRTILRGILLFCFCLTWFVINGSWYEAERLRIEGVVSALPARVEVLWDSDSGFNRYERKGFNLDTTLPAGQTRHDIRIRYADARNGASLAKDVLCRTIWVDGSPVDLVPLAAGGAVVNEEGVLLDLPGAELRLQTEARESIRIELATNNHSGKVEVEINGRHNRYDLYMANVEANTLTIEHWIVDDQGRFAVEMVLPRYALRHLDVRTVPGTPENRFTRITVDRKGQTITKLDQPEGVPAQALYKINRESRSYFHPVHFSLQLLFAACTTWGLLILLQSARRFQTWRNFLLGEQRGVFWGFFVVALCWFSLFLAAFWPGVMSVDSLKIWRAAMLPGVFLNDHPVLNVVLYMYLMQLWNHVAIVPLVQIFFTALLGASIFFWLYRQGLSLPWLLPFYLAFVLSLPVALYNLMLWKDIPFALLVVFLAWTVVRLYERKRTGIPIASRQWVMLILLSLALAFTRHNGIVYLLFIPVLLCLLGFVPLRRIIQTAVVFTVLGLVAVAMVRFSGHSLETNYLTQQGRGHVKQMLRSGVGERLLTAVKAYPGVLDINQTASKWDLFHFYLNDRYDYRFLTRAGWNDVYPYAAGPPGKHPLPPSSSIMAWYTHSYTEPLVFFTWNPVFLLLLFPVAILLFPLLPRSAIYAGFFLVQVAALLVVVHVLNWRYYYFLYLGSLFLVPLMLLDLKTWWQNRQHRTPHAL
jgi:hypothetical protein